MIEHKRVNISPLAKQFKAEGAPNSMKGLNHLDRKDKFQFWQELKPEYLALLAIFTNRIVNRALDARSSRKPFGLIRTDSIDNPTKIEPINELDNFLYAYIGMRDTLNLSLNEEIKENSLPSDSKNTDSRNLKSAWERLHKIIEKMEAIYPQSSKLTIKQSLQGGIGTATEVMAGCLEVIPKLSDGKNPDTFIQIAKNSYPLIAKLAMMDSRILEPMMFSFRGFPVLAYQQKFFTIEGAGKNSRLSLSQEGKDLQKLAETKIKDYLSNQGIDLLNTFGCPAMVNFDGKPTVKKLWDWHVEIAQQIYPKLRKTT